MEKGEFMNNVPEANKPYQELEKKLTVKEKPLEKGINRGGKISSRMQTPGVLKDGLEGHKDQGRSIALKPEAEDKLKKFSVEIVRDGKTEVKTAVDAVRGIETLASEKGDEVFSGSLVLVDELLRRYGDKSPEGEELRGILFDEVLGGGDKNKGQELRDWLQNEVGARGEGKMQIDGNGLAEIMGWKLDQQEMTELQDLFILPVPVGGNSGGNEDVVVAPIGEVEGKAGQVTPVPSEDKGISGIPEASKISETSKKSEIPKVVVKSEKEKKSFWERFKENKGAILCGQGLLVLLILYFSIMGKVANIIEQSAERSRGGA